MFFKFPFAYTCTFFKINEHFIKKEKMNAHESVKKYYSLYLIEPSMCVSTTQGNNLARQSVNLDVNKVVRIVVGEACLKTEATAGPGGTW